MKKTLTILAIAFSGILLSAPIRSTIGARNSIIAEPDSDFSEVEYLESTGTQYIVLQTHGQIIKGVDLNVQFLISDANYGPYGIWNNGSRGNRIYFWDRSGRGILVSNYFVANIYSGLQIKDRIVSISVLKTNVLIDGQSFVMGHEWDSYNNYPGDTVGLFGCYNISTKSVNCVNCRIGRCTIYVGDNLDIAYNFIPVRIGKGTGAKGYMYDTISGEYYGNQGTGSFIIGPDKE